MKTSDLKHEIARHQGIRPEDAAIQVDRAVTRIIRLLRSGESARLPGIGTINPGKQWTFRSERPGHGEPPTPGKDAAANHEC